MDLVLPPSHLSCLASREMTRCYWQPHISHHRHRLQDPRGRARDRHVDSRGPGIHILRFLTPSLVMPVVVITTTVVITQERRPDSYHTRLLPFTRAAQIFKELGIHNKKDPLPSYQPERQDIGPPRAPRTRRTARQPTKQIASRLAPGLRHSACPGI